MKTLANFRLAFGLFFLLVSTLAHAQASAPTPALPGYWNTETNLTTRDCSLVRFYNGQDKLVYEERLFLCLDLNKGPRRRGRITRQLDVVLQQVLRNPELARQSANVLAQQLLPNHRVQRIYAAR